MPHFFKPWKYLNWVKQYWSRHLYRALIRSVFTSASVPCIDQVSIYLCLCTLQRSGQHLPLPLYPALIRSVFTSASVPCTDQVSIYLCLHTVHRSIPLITNFGSKMSQYPEGGREGEGGNGIVSVPWMVGRGKALFSVVWRGPKLCLQVCTGLLITEWLVLVRIV